MKFESFIRNAVIGCAFVLLLVQFSCSKYLDIVPDNVATIDNAFTLRNEAEKFLFTCYSYIPHDGEAGNIGFFGGDEMWVSKTKRDLNIPAWDIARGFQSSSSVACDYWGGGNGGIQLFQAIANCNIFLENIADTSKVKDLQLDERVRWIGEATFLKAYYNYLLLRMFGPIPINDKNLPISSSPVEVKVYRQPFDSCVNYIAGLLDEAASKLPLKILNRSNEMGRITQPIAKAIKAKLLVLAASPLFNGNPDYKGIKDNRGISLFNATQDKGKWVIAAQACKDAIDIADKAGAKLYYFPEISASNLSQTTITKLNIRQAICDRWNDEEIWGLSNSLVGGLQNSCMARLDPKYASNVNAKSNIGAPLKMAEMFYTQNGVPINEDKTLNFSKINTLRTATHDERFNIGEGYTTARLNFDREPRFYADLGFDGATWYLKSSPSGTDDPTYLLKAKLTQYGGNNIVGYENPTGYYIKKLVDYDFAFTDNGVSVRNYEWPEIRLADIYLLYAEAQNEAAGPSDLVYKYVDSIRSRAGLEGVAESWTKYSTNPLKYTTQSGMRDIIKRERGIELAFEGSRFWDLRRWKDAANELNAPVMGWAVGQQTELSYYQPQVVFQQTFVAPRDYLWPIWLGQFMIDDNLVQNLGWSQ